MQGIPLEDPKDYIPLLPKSLDASLEGAINNEVSFEIGSSTPLEESILPINPLLGIAQDSHFLWKNSSRDLVADEYIEIPTGPNIDSGVDDPFFQSESIRTLVTLLGILILALLVLVILFGELLQDKIFLIN